MNIDTNNLENWELDVLGIGNWRSNLFPFKKYFNFIKSNHNKLVGDLAEFGVFNGKSLLATALLLKKLKSKKKIYAFDSFKGLLKFRDQDKFINFKYQKNNQLLLKKNYYDHKKLIFYRNFLLSKKITPKNISGSNNFSSVNLSILKKKIKLLKLNNIIIIKGDFDKTLSEKKLPFKKLMSVNIDCDLWDSYVVILNKIEKFLVKKSFIHLDEYYSLKFPGARTAVDIFLKNNNNYSLKSFKKKNCFPRYFLLKKNEKL